MGSMKNTPIELWFLGEDAIDAVKIEACKDLEDGTSREVVEPVIELYRSAVVIHEMSRMAVLLKYGEGVKHFNTESLNNRMMEQVHAALDGELSSPMVDVLKMASHLVRLADERANQNEAEEAHDD